MALSRDSDVVAARRVTVCFDVISLFLYTVAMLTNTLTTMHELHYEHTGVVFPLAGEVFCWGYILYEWLLFKVPYWLGYFCKHVVRT